VTNSKTIKALEKRLAFLVWKNLTEGLTYIEYITFVKIKERIKKLQAEL